MKNVIKLFLFIIIGCLKSNRNAEHVDCIEQIILTQNWDDFIEYRHGNIPLIIISVHGGKLLPDWIETRTYQDLFPNTLRTSPKRSPLKPLHRNLRVKAMISKDLKGFRLCPLV